MLVGPLFPPNQNVAQRYSSFGLFYPLVHSRNIGFIFGEILYCDLIFNHCHLDI